MEYILQNTMLALLEYPGSTLLDVNRMLSNKVFRKAVVDSVKDPIVKTFWVEEFATYTDRYTQEATPAIQNKVGQFTANPLVRNIVGQPTSSFDLRKMMDEKKIFVVNLSKGRMGESNAALLGSMLTVKIYLAAMSRAEEPASRMAKLPRCYFYVDEFQSMMNEAFADILSESRKYKLALTLANQYIEQMEENVRDAVFGNVGTLITFRVGPFDAEVLETVFEPTFTAEDQVSLGVGQIYLTLMIDGVGSAPFSAETIPPIEQPSVSYRDDVVRHSRDVFSRPRADIEALVLKNQEDFAPPQKKEKKPFDERRPDERRREPQEHPRAPFSRPPQSSQPSYARPQAPAFSAQVAKENMPERSALRAALESARGPAPTPGVAAPIDILRARQAAREGRFNPQAAEPKPESELAPETKQEIRPKKPLLYGASELPENNELSTAELRRVLYGEEGSH